MNKKVFALGIDPGSSGTSRRSAVSTNQVGTCVDQQLSDLEARGYEIVTCLIDANAIADAAVIRHLLAHRFDCVLFGAGLRDPGRLVLYERLLNLVHSYAPEAKICFNTSAADSLEAVRRWI